MDTWLDGFLAAFNLDARVVTFKSVIDQMAASWEVLNKWQRDEFIKHLLGDQI